MAPVERCLECDGTKVAKGIVMRDSKNSGVIVTAYEKVE